MRNLGTEPSSVKQNSFKNVKTDARKGPKQMKVKTEDAIKPQI